MVGEDNMVSVLSGTCCHSSAVRALRNSTWRQGWSRMTCDRVSEDFSLRYVYPFIVLEVLSAKTIESVYADSDFATTHCSAFAAWDKSCLVTISAAEKMNQLHQPNSSEGLKRYGWSLACFVLCFSLLKVQAICVGTSPQKPRNRFIWLLALAGLHDGREGPRLSGHA